MMTLPSLGLDVNGVNETVYRSGWYVHAPADHTVPGARSKAELHFMHVNSERTPRALLALRIDPGNADSSFFATLPDWISHGHVNVTGQMDGFNPSLVLNELNQFSKCWTYRGKCSSSDRREDVTDALWICR